MDRGNEILAGVFLTNPDHPDEIADPATLDGDPVAAAINHDTQRERITTFAALKPRERRDLLLHAGGYTYDEIAQLSQGVRVNVAMLGRSDVGDMSLMEASPPFVVHCERRGRRVRLLLLPRCASEPCVARRLSALALLAQAQAWRRLALAWLMA